jgi:ribonucleotide monophosphatase NagD (HAD superfamily)
VYGYLIDMDRVIYRVSHRIPGADRFIQELRTAEVPFLFLTNNSQRTRRHVATNLDPNCPTQTGLRPGCGAIVAMLEAASGLKAFTVGKPSPLMMRSARKELGLRAEQTIVIGDTMETDILGGVQLGYKTVLVLSGGTHRENLARFAYRPDKVVESIADLSHAQLVREFAAAAAPDPPRPPALRSANHFWAATPA